MNNYIIGHLRRNVNILTVSLRLMNNNVIGHLHRNVNNYVSSKVNE